MRESAALLESAGRRRASALHTQAVIQGSFILAKAKGSAAAAAESLDHLRALHRAAFPGAGKVRVGRKNRPH